MNQAERKVFWDTLCSLEGNDIQKDSQRLKECIKLPRFLFRYRPITVRTIDALQTNKLYLSLANYYDDPFDTLIHIDFDMVNERARQMLGADNVKSNLHQMGEMLRINEEEITKASQFLDKLSMEELLTGIDILLKTNIQSILKQNLWSVCFSESGTNETMWLKYADQYKGFCAVYDLTNANKLLCGKQDKCQNCVVQRYGTSLYPMYYSNQGYDATQYAGNLTLAILAQQHLNPDIAEVILKSLPAGQWEQEKISLIKSKCHEHDEEWRMLLRGPSTPPVMQEWIPHGIILGLRISDNDRRIITRSAKLAGIEHIFESYIDNQYHLATKEIEI